MPATTNEHQTLAAQLALLGVRYPEAPQWSDIIEGPFNGRTTITNAMAATEVRDLLSGTTAGVEPALASDIKLNSVGINLSGSRPTGVLMVEAIGIDIDAENCTAKQYSDILAQWALVHIPQGTQRKRSVSLLHIARLQVTRFDPAAVAIGVGPQVAPVFRLVGGSWRVNVQSDTLQLQQNPATGLAPVALTATMNLGIRLYGVFITSGRAQSLGLLGSPPTCPSAPSVIAKVIAGRRSLGQSVYHPG